MFNVTCQLHMEGDKMEHMEHILENILQKF